MNTNKVTIIGSIIAIFLIIAIPTIYKVIINYQDKLYHVVEEKIIAGAKKCYYDDVCQSDKITLAKLYENNYLEEVSNPITKEYYNNSSFVEVAGNDFKFVIVERHF